MLYFAYGSNMLTARLSARCPGAEFVCRASMAGHHVRFAKRGKDGSGKATLIPADATTYGLLFRIPEKEWPALDAAEGPGYTRLTGISVITPSGTKTCDTFQAKHPEPGLLPFDWYLALIIAGCHEHGLANPFEHQTFTTDPLGDRTGRRDALTALANPDWQSMLPQIDNS